MRTSHRSFRRSTVEVEIDEECVLRAVHDDAIRAECGRRHIGLVSDSDDYPLPRDDLDEALALLQRGSRREALLVLERALPRAFRDAFTQPRWA